MDETIGVKGGKNDRRRFLFITKKKQEKLAKDKEKEEKELEKKVKKNQIFILIKTIPIVLVGGTFKTLYDVAHGKSRDKEEEGSKWRIKEYDADFTTKSRQEDEREKHIKDKYIVVNEDKKIKVRILKNKRAAKKNETSSKEDPVIIQTQNTIPIPTTDKNNIKGPVSIIRQKHYQLPATKNKEKNSYEADTNIHQELLPESQQKRLERLKAHKIIDVYEKELKDLRYELRQLAADFYVLKDQEDEIVYSQDADIILNRLSQVIDKIELLKKRLEIENIDQYDDNYIYTLIEDYLTEFRNGVFISDIKDSPLYVLISEKLQEIDYEKDQLQTRVKNKKNALEEREIQFENLKDQYYSIEKVNQALLEFQSEQDFLLREVAEKIENAITIEEKVKVEIAAMNAQSRKLLQLLSFQMFFPGFFGAKKVASSTALYLYFVNQILNPKTTTKKYRVISVSDYRKDIENSMEALDNANYLLAKTSAKIDDIILQIEDTFKDYIGVNHECDQLLANLYRIKGDIKEKEYEMEKLKQQQVALMEKNEAKVKTRGEYPM